MKNLKSILTVTLIVIATMAYSQNYTFRVMVNKGSNQVNSGGEWQALKTGAQLKENDELKVSENAYLGLMHAGGRTLEWKEAGTYKVSELAGKVSAGSSVASKYADFLANKMSAESKKNRLSATGAVHRAISEAEINVHMPGTVQIYRDNAIIRWDPVEGDNIVYKVTLKNMFEDVLISEETSETFYEINLAEEKIENQNVVLLTVSTADDENIASDVIAIKKLPSGDVEKVSNGLEELMSDIQDESALNKYILAGFYEENNLLIDALTSYEEAIRLAPEVDMYQEAYDEFLLRNGLKTSN